MTNPISHRATPENWRIQEQWAARGDVVASCLLGLRSRLAAAEQRISELQDDSTHVWRSTHFCFEAVISRLERLEGHSQSTPNDRQIRSSAPAGSLVERVASAHMQCSPEVARAAILAVAEWLEGQEPAFRGGAGSATASIDYFAAWLREEVER